MFGTFKERMDVASTVPTDDTPMDEFFAQGNALERGTPIAPVVAEPAEPAAVEEPPAGMERDAQGKFVKKADAAEKPAEKVAKPRNDPQARIDQIVREREDARREAAALKAENEALKRPRQEPPQSRESAQPQTQAEWARFKTMAGYPKSEDFQDYDDLTIARQVFVDRVLRHEDGERARTQHQQRQREDETRSLNESWQARLTEARTKNPDLVAGINPETPLSAPMMHVIKKSPNGPALLRRLSDDQPLAQRLSTLHPDEALWEMGKLERDAEAATSGPAPVVSAISHAKPPIKPLGTSPVTSAAGPPDDSASVDDHIRYYNSQERKRRA